jgi:hypothetical protein
MLRHHIDKFPLVLYGHFSSSAGYFFPLKDFSGTLRKNAVYSLRGENFVNRTGKRNFQRRFGDTFEVVYSTKPVDVEERRFSNERLSQAIKAVMADVLKREPTPREFLGVDQIIVK